MHLSGHRRRPPARAGRRGPRRRHRRDARHRADRAGDLRRRPAASARSAAISRSSAPVRARSCRRRPASADDRRRAVAEGRAAPPRRRCARSRSGSSAARQAGGIFSFREVSDVHIGGPGTLVDDGIQLPDGGRVTRTLIDPAAFKDGIGIDATKRRHRGHARPRTRRRRSGPRVRRHRLRTGSAGVLGAHGSSRDGPRRRRAETVGVSLQPQRSSAGAVSAVVHIRDSLLHGLGTALSRSGVAANPATGLQVALLRRRRGHRRPLFVARGHAGATTSAPVRSPPARRPRGSRAAAGLRRRAAGRLAADQRR